MNQLLVTPLKIKSNVSFFKVLLREGGKFFLYVVCGHLTLFTLGGRGVNFFFVFELEGI